MKGSTRQGAPARGQDSHTIDLGREPPLAVGDQREGVPARRAVSIRWLAGTVLTGLTSTILMGGALMAALDGRHQLALPPESGKIARAPADAALANGHKGDRIRPIQQAVANRQVIQVSTITRQGDSDLIKMKPFARISASLATRITDLSADRPAFDPLRLFADDAAPAPPPEAAQTAKLGVIADEGDSGDGDTGPDDVAGSGDGADMPADGDGVTTAEAGADQIYGANVEGEVSVKVSDFPVDGQPADDDTSFTTAEVEETLRTIGGAAANGVQLTAYVDPGRFSFDESDNDPFSALGVRIVPENVSFVSKSSPNVQLSEKIATIEKKKSLADVLDDNDVAEGDAANILSAMSSLIDLQGLHQGQKVRIAYGPGENDAMQATRVSIYDEGVHQATVARRDDGSFTRADEPETSTDEFDTADQTAPVYDGPMPKVYDAIYETALEQKIPDPLIKELVRIFSYDVDLQGKISAGDGLEVFHSLPEDGGSEDDDEILYAAITLDGTTKRYYRFRSPDDGVVDYFDEEGKSAKKFLVRKPMNSGIVRSNFGYRRHPILGYARLHAGVDWAAPRGTPIAAAGNGVVEKAGWSSGYGNFTLIRHTNGYETAYGHQSAIAKGIRPGMRVRQGQIIGYVGSTGLSTGPHLHYEVRINGKAVDPLRVRLPRGRVLQGDMLASFEREKNRIDSLIGAQSPAKVASLGDVPTQ